MGVMCGAFVCSCRHGARFNRVTRGVSNANQDVVRVWSME